MRWFVLVLSCLAVAGCGGGGNTELGPAPADPAAHNNAVVSGAQHQEQSRAAILKKLDARLKLYDDPDDPYLTNMYVVRGRECSIDEVELFDPTSELGSHDLLSPDGRWAVAIATVFDGTSETPLSWCLSVAKEALGW